MERPRIIILSSREDYWEALYVDGKCKFQAHHIEEGQNKLSFYKKLMAEYGVTLDDIVEIGAEEVDDDLAMQTGQFPDKFDDLQGYYDFSNFNIF